MSLALLRRTDDTDAESPEAVRHERDRLRRDNQHLAHELRRREEYIDGLEALARSRPR